MGSSPGRAATFSFAVTFGGQIHKCSNYAEVISVHCSWFAVLRAMKHLPVHHHSADHSLWSFGIINSFSQEFTEASERVLLKPVMWWWWGGMVGVTQFITSHEQN